MSDSHRAAINAIDVEAGVGTSYPEVFKKEVASRSKRVLGDLYGLTNYGVNLVELAPGAWSAQRHWHTREDEFVYVLAGEMTLVTDGEKQILTAGMIAGFPAGESKGHHLINESDLAATYLEIGDRNEEDEVFYPDIDLQLVSGPDGERIFTNRHGDPYV